MFDAQLDFDNYVIKATAICSLNTEKEVTIKVLLERKPDAMARKNRNSTEGSPASQSKI